MGGMGEMGGIVICHLSLVDGGHGRMGGIGEMFVTRSSPVRSNAFRRYPVFVVTPSGVIRCS